MKHKGNSATVGGSHNHGTQKDRNVWTPYGTDRSSFVGPASKERAGISRGGVNNLSHSLSGSSAKQTHKG